jgi:DNA modification methylase
MEDTPEEFVENLVNVFKEVKRVLRDDGTVWLNLGDSYSSGGRTTTTNQSLRGDKEYGVTRPKPSKGIKPKDLIGIPWRVAFALQSDGWYLRQDIIWHKPNPMPESVRDRCTKAHEYIFLLSKNVKYYYDHEAIKEDSVRSGSIPKGKKYSSELADNKIGGKHTRETLNEKPVAPKKNKRSVWKVSTKPYKGAHFATFPKDLIEPCVLAGCPKKVCVECDEPYINKPIYEYIDKTSSTSNTHGKYGNQEIEASNRQGLHANRGNKLIEVRDNLPKQSVFVNFIRNKTNAKTLAENTNIKLTKIEHWFRNDESGFAYPSIDDWIKVRDFVNDWSNEFTEIDNCLTSYELKSDAVESKKINGHGLQKQCDCQTNETKAGTVLDPFGGSGTTGIVAAQHDRNAVLLELNQEYINLAYARIEKEMGMFAELKVEMKHD